MWPSASRHAYVTVAATGLFDESRRTKRELMVVVSIGSLNVAAICAVARTLEAPATGKFAIIRGAVTSGPVVGLKTTSTK